MRQFCNKKEVIKVLKLELSWSSYLCPDFLKALGLAEFAIFIDRKFSIPSYFSETNISTRPFTFFHLEGFYNATLSPSFNLRKVLLIGVEYVSQEKFGTITWCQGEPHKSRAHVYPHHPHSFQNISSFTASWNAPTLRHLNWAWASSLLEEQKFIQPATLSLSLYNYLCTDHSLRDHWIRTPVKRASFNWRLDSYRALNFAIIPTFGLTAVTHTKRVSENMW